MCLRSPQVLESRSGRSRDGDTRSLHFVAAGVYLISRGVAISFADFLGGNKLPGPTKCLTKK